MLSASRLLGRCAARARGVAPRRMCSTGGGAPPSVGEAPLPPIRNALDKLPKSVLKNNLDPLDLQKANSFLGFSLRSTHPASYRNLLGHVGGQTMIDPEETLFAMRRALALLKKVSFRGGRTLFISTTPMLARLTRVVGQQSGQFYLAKRWVPGLLTNWDKGRAHIRKKLTLVRPPPARSTGAPARPPASERLDAAVEADHSLPLFPLPNTLARAPRNTQRHTPPSTALHSPTYPPPPPPPDPPPPPPPSSSSAGPAADGGGQAAQLRPDEGQRLPRRGANDETARPHLPARRDAAARRAGQAQHTRARRPAPLLPCSPAPLLHGEPDKLNIPVRSAPARGGGVAAGRLRLPLASACACGPRGAGAVGSSTPPTSPHAHHPRRSLASSTRTTTRRASTTRFPPTLSPSASTTRWRTCSSVA